MTNAESLKNRDYYLLIDKSGSMQDNDTPTGQSRFAYAQESTTAIAKKLEEFDPDGITIIPFASSFKIYDNVTSAKVKDVFYENEPMGGTSLCGPLKAVFSKHLEMKKAGTLKANGSMIVVITDGEPQDKAEVARAIADFTQKLDNGDDEIGIALIQVGRDANATKFLKMLDDDIKGAKYDIVDTKTIDEVEQIGLVETLIAALVD